MAHNSEGTARIDGAWLVVVLVSHLEEVRGRSVPRNSRECSGAGENAVEVLRMPLRL